jgi:uncharacterized protein DUF6680
VKREVSADHVQALNMIDIEFYGGRTTEDRAVVDAWKIYLDHLNHKYDDRQLDAWVEKGTDLFTELLFAMSKALGLKFDKVHLKRGVYFPIAHAETSSRTCSSFEKGSSNSSRIRPHCRFFCLGRSAPKGLPEKQPRVDRQQLSRLPRSSAGFLRPFLVDNLTKGPASAYCRRHSAFPGPLGGSDTCSIAAGLRGDAQSRTSPNERSAR